ncbi:uncharacterized protein PgNI_04322 [Pyricularia grisea]|uniref:Uncharacterized protein n=1 Tax=Pyricularia grisea TaxID=148305 RepID=A0A6P8BDF3_PYRGI|nr:uncharacterized protein PgNI_04322 [Pyricularia grisea]TLD13697.1 hypothetical protein PgNI_04322 [Pyricularia grisea]
MYLPTGRKGEFRFALPRIICGEDHAGGTPSEQHPSNNTRMNELNSAMRVGGRPRRKQQGAFLTHPRKHKIEARLLLQSHENSTV